MLNSTRQGYMVIPTRSTLACALLGLLTTAGSLGAQEILLRPGDAIRVMVPREKDLSGQFDVDETSAVTIPTIGRVEVGGKPWSGVRAALLTALQREVREPGIVLTPLRRVVVLGSVTKPGTFLLEPTITLSGAIALAAGVTPEGDLRRIRLVRDDSVRYIAAPKGREIDDIALQSGDQLFVLQRSWVARNSALLITTLLSITGLVAVLHK
jgi:protein involved in polysaccharide export with SLBB domain